VNEDSFAEVDEHAAGPVRNCRATAETPRVPEPPAPATSACHASYLDLSTYDAGRARGDFLRHDAADV
jgi:hypothetical protein